MEYITTTLGNLVHQTAFFSLTWGNVIMIAVACFFLYLAIRHGFEPLLLVPIAFGMLLVNIYPDIMLHAEDAANGVVNAVEKGKNGDIDKSLHIIKSVGPEYGGIAIVELKRDKQNAHMDGQEHGSPAQSNQEKNKYGEKQMNVQSHMTGGGNVRIEVGGIGHYIVDGKNP